MGKKPVVGLIGLVWAGIALTGCGECCRNTRNTYNPKSTWETKDPSIKGPVAGPNGPGDLTPAKPPVEPTGPGPISDARPKGITPDHKAVGHWEAPKSQSALRATDTDPGDLPTQPKHFRARETGATPEVKRDPGMVNMPPRPPVTKREPAVPSESMRKIDAPASESGPELKPIEPPAPPPPPGVPPAPAFPPGK